MKQGSDPGPDTSRIERDPELRVFVRLLHPRRDALIVAVADGVAVLTIGDGEPSRKIVAAAQLTAELARAIELGPRRATEPAHVSTSAGMLEVMARTAGRLEGYDRATDAAAIVDSLKLWCAISAVDEKKGTGRTLEVLDAGDHGWWLVRRANGDVDLDRITPTGIWRLLTSLFDL